MGRTQVGKIGFILMPLFLVAISFPLRKYFDRTIDLDKKNSGTELATVISTEGPVLIRHNNKTQFETAVMDDLIDNKDQIRVENGGSAKIRLNTGTEIELSEGTDVVFETWRKEAEDSLLYLHFYSGDYKVIHLDHVRPIYVSMNDNIFLIQSKSKEARRKLNIRQTPSSLGREQKETATVETEEDVKLAEQNVDGSPTNAYIDQTIATQKSLFQKCQTNSIRGKKQSKGQVTVGLTISPSGSVSEAKLLNTNFKELELPNCAIDVIRRIRFKSYKGDEVIRSYPLQFE